MVVLSLFAALHTTTTTTTTTTTDTSKYLFRIGHGTASDPSDPTLTMQITDLSSLFECVLSRADLEAERVKQGVIFGDVDSMVRELCGSAGGAAWDVERSHDGHRLAVTMRATIEDGLGEMLFNFSMTLENVGHERFASEVVTRLLVCANELSRWVAAMGQILSSKDAEAAQCRQQFPATRAVLRSPPFSMDNFADKMVASASNLLGPNSVPTSQTALYALQEVMQAADTAAIKGTVEPATAASAAAAPTQTQEASFLNAFSPSFSLPLPPSSASLPAAASLVIPPDDSGSNDGAHPFSSSQGAGSSLGLLMDLKHTAEAVPEHQPPVAAHEEVIDPHAIVHKFANNAVYVETKEELERKRKREEELEEQRKKAQQTKAQAAKRFKI
jgi:hypothetical protein